MLILLLTILLNAKSVNFASVPAHLLDKKITCNNTKLNKDLNLYCNELKGINQKIFLKLAKMNKISKSNGTYDPYIDIYKDKKQFYLETFLYLDTSFKDALPYIKDYNSYGDWILENFNTSKSGVKDMGFIKVNYMKFNSKKNIITVGTKLDFVFKKKYQLFLKVKENFDLKIAKQLHLKILKPTSLTPKIEGTFIFFEIPNSKYMILFFYGYAKLHWALYNVLPLKFLRVFVSEKLEIMYENVGYKVEDINDEIEEAKEKKMKKIEKEKKKLKLKQ